MATNPKTSRRAATAKTWSRDAAPLRHVGEEDFRAIAMRRGVDRQLLGGTRTTRHGKGKLKQWAGMVTEVTWDDAGPILTGAITLQRPPYEGATPDVVDGDEIRLEYRETDGAAWRELWTMRVYEPQYDFAADTVVFTLSTDLGLLDASEDDFVYQKSKKKPNGWLVHEAMADVCRRYGVKAQLTATRTRITKGGVQRNVSPWQFLKKMKKIEEQKTGRKLVLRYDSKRNVLRMEPLKRSQAMLILGPTLIAAALDKQRQERFATAVTVRQAGWHEGAKGAKGHRRTKPKKMYATYRSAAAVRRYGYIHRIVYSPDATSRGDLLREAKRWVAAVIKPQRQFTLTHPGIPTLRRGHAILINIESEGLKTLIFVTALHFRVGGGEFYMDATLDTDDPYADDRDQKVIDKLTDSPRRSQRAGTKKKKKPGANRGRTAPPPRRPRKTPGQVLGGKYGGP